MSFLLPNVHHMVVCEDIRSKPEKPHGLSPIHLLGRILSSSYHSFPHHPLAFCVYAHLASAHSTLKSRKPIVTDHYSPDTEIAALL